MFDYSEARKRILNLMTREGNWYQIRNATDSETAEIRIYDEIGWLGKTAEDFAAELDAVTAPNILVRINSIGGSVFDGIAIYNSLRTHDSRVVTRVDSMAASIASVIAQAGDHRQVVQAGQMMIHDAHGLAIGNADDMREFADLLDKQSDIIAGIYAERSGGDKAKFRDLMAESTWFSDDETVDAGLADEVHVPPRKEEAAEQETEAKTTDWAGVFAEAFDIDPLETI